MYESIISEAKPKEYESIFDKENPREYAKSLCQHHLKSWVGLFEPIYDGLKTHDLRVLDRKYKVGDLCFLSEWDAAKSLYTGRCVVVEITYITSGSGDSTHNPCAFSPIALHPAMGVLSIKVVYKA